VARKKKLKPQWPTEEELDRLDAEEAEEGSFMVNGVKRRVDTWLTPGFYDALKKRVKDRDGNECYICGSPKRLHVHHIIPRNLGGPHTMENLVTLCSGCHMSIESGNIEVAINSCVRRAIRATAPQHPSVEFDPLPR